MHEKESFPVAPVLCEILKLLSVPEIRKVSILLPGNYPLRPLSRAQPVVIPTHPGYRAVHAGWVRISRAAFDITFVVAEG